MSVLEDLLAPLDWGRQSLVGAGEGGLGLLEGDFSRRNLLKLLPAAAGLGAGALTGGLAAAPVGSLVAALTQGLGKGIAPQTFQAPTTGEMLEGVGGDPESFWQNLAMGVATDPWTYTGIGLGKRAGQAVGAKVGGNLERAAYRAGPMYETTADDIIEMANRRNAEFFPPDVPGAPDLRMVPGVRANTQGPMPALREAAATRAEHIGGMAADDIRPLSDALLGPPELGPFGRLEPSRAEGFYTGTPTIPSSLPRPANDVTSRFVGPSVNPFAPWRQAQELATMTPEKIATSKAISDLAASEPQLAALQRMVLAEPGNQGPVMVMADYLEQTGRTDIAEMVRGTLPASSLSPVPDYFSVQSGINDALGQLGFTFGSPSSQLPPPDQIAYWLRGADNALQRVRAANIGALHTDIDYAGQQIRRALDNPEQAGDAIGRAFDAVERMREAAGSFPATSGVPGLPGIPLHAGGQQPATILAGMLDAPNAPGLMGQVADFENAARTPLTRELLTDPVATGRLQQQLQSFNNNPEGASVAQQLRAIMGGSGRSNDFFQMSGRGNEQAGTAGFLARLLAEGDTANPLLREIPPGSSLVEASPFFATFRRPGGGMTSLRNMGTGAEGERFLLEELQDAVNSPWKTRAVGSSGYRPNPEELAAINETSRMSRGQLLRQYGRPTPEEIIPDLTPDNYPHWNVSHESILGNKTIPALNRQGIAPLTGQTVGQPSPVMEALIRLLGGPEAVRRSLATGEYAPGIQEMLSALGGYYGGAAGAATSPMSRALLGY